MISIHAPTRGATSSLPNKDKLRQFQSTLPRGERPGMFSFTYSSLPISIHAPTRGATQIDRCIDVNLIFQSTLPRGERQNRQMQCRLLKNFNPRSHEGSDDEKFILMRRTQDISIHAPTRGATLCQGNCTLVQEISIHAPTRGATVLLSLHFS